MKLKHGGNNANIDWYEPVGDDTWYVNVLRYDVDFHFDSDGARSTVQRRIPRYIVTVRVWTPERWIDELKFEYEPTRKPRNPVLPPTTVARLIREHQEANRD